MPRNVEFKARLLDRPAARAAAAIVGAVPAGVLRQTDTYFHVPTGRLKLRATPDGAELIAYDRPDAAGPRTSAYHRVPADPALGDVLAAALGVRTVVRKVRELWLWENVRIHLDAVTGLGEFLEFEVIVGPDHPADACAARLAALIRAFGFTDADGIPGSYADAP